MDSLVFAIFVTMIFLVAIALTYFDRCSSDHGDDEPIVPF